MLFGNTLRWDVEYLARQLPVLPARDGLPRKVKPLVRLTERETAAWCVVRGIDYMVEECPMAEGNRHLAYKAALNAVERDSPGTKAAFYLNFVERMVPLLADVRADTVASVGHVLTVRVTDHRRGLRVLPVGRQGLGARTRARRADRPAAEVTPFQAGEKALLIDAKQRRYLITLVEGGEFHSHNGFVPHDELIGQREGIVAAQHAGRDVHRAAPDAGGLRRRDAPRRAGDLSQGSRPDLHARRHRPGRAGVRERRRQWGVEHDDAALGRVDRRLRAARGLRQPRQDQRARLPRRGRTGPLRRLAARLLRRHRRARPRPGGARPARAVAGGAPRPRRAAPRRDPRRLHAVDHPGVAAARGAGHQGLECPPLVGGAPSRLARGRASPCGPTTGWSRTPGS